MNIADQFLLKPIALALMAIAANTAVASTPPTTTTPIKHVIVLIGENRTFDNVYGTYVPHKGEKIANLLSKGIVNADGSPGPNASMAAQSTLLTVPKQFFVSQPALNKTPYSTLPVPNTGYVPAVGATLAQIKLAPYYTAAPLATDLTTSQLHQISPALPVWALPLLTTGGTNMSICNISATQTYPTYPAQGCYENDSRITNYAALANTVFPLQGASLPYDSYTGDSVHRFYHMWEQSDCNVSHATVANPSGCLNDLYPYVGVARNDGSTSNSMGFYNVQKGDAPILKALADEYTISDNYHQPVMGGTFVQHMMLGSADAMPWQAYTNTAGVTVAKPPVGVQVNPTPKSATNAAFTADKAWTSCNTQWAQAVNNYEATLPWQPNMSSTACTPGQFYQINNASPGYLPNGWVDDIAITNGAKTPPSTVRTIGDALNEQSISWAYYGGGWNAAVRAANGSTNPIDQWMAAGYYCDICNPFQYSKAIMGDATQRATHLKDATDFFTDLQNGNLPAVTYLKPDSFTDGHPASSKLDLFEALTARIHGALKSNPAVFNETVLFVTWDEGGGYWDSGFIQPVDFFGDGPRIPMIAVSPYARGGHVDHTYGDHASILKFIERNWGLQPLTARSRDNLPNPVQTSADTYVPTNMPAVGDLMGMFTFK